MVHRIEKEFGGRTLSIETGRVAKQANGGVWIQYGETIVLVTACRTKNAEDRGFLPLTVDYREKSYAGGRIPGNIFKREARPTEKETLSARLTDHQIRPMFPKGFPYEVQVYITVLSVDGENDADVLGMLGASAALCISDICFEGPMGAVRVGRVDGNFVINPTYSQLEESDLDLIVSGTAESIASVEGGAHEILEADLLEALKFGHEHVRALVEFQSDLVEKVGKPKLEFEAPPVDEALAEAVEGLSKDKIAAANRTEEKEARELQFDELKADTIRQLSERFPEGDRQISDVLDNLAKKYMRRMIIEEKRRIDGRAVNEVRPINCEIGLLPRAHGSALFTRGETQALCTSTLGAKMDERMADDLRGKTFKSYFLDYNFPAFSVGEVRFERGPGRRDYGHGHLAERALEPVIPAVDSFPYTIRLVSDITESNSSSSMASVCGCSLALMDAGIPIRTHVSGAGVGLVTEGDDWELLTDIQGAEDFLGDMDLKVAVTEDGITAIQMDIKIRGISFEIMEQALERAFEGRMYILGIMNECIAEHRPELSQHAPRIEFMKIDPSKIGTVIGPGGKMIREIESYGVSVTVEDDGTITISSADSEASDQARSTIEALTSDAEIGKVYKGTVRSIKPFGAFVEILPGKDGLLHISELAHRRIDRVEDVVKEGQNIEVKVLDIDPGGKIRLSHKALISKDNDK